MQSLWTPITRKTEFELNPEELGTFACLPLEVISHMTSFFTGEEIVNICLLSRSFRVIGQDSFFRHHLQRLNFLLSHLGNQLNSDQYPYLLPELSEMQAKLKKETVDRYLRENNLSIKEFFLLKQQEMLYFVDKINLEEHVDLIIDPSLKVPFCFTNFFKTMRDLESLGCAYSRRDEVLPRKRLFLYAIAERLLNFRKIYEVLRIAEIIKQLEMGIEEEKRTSFLLYAHTIAVVVISQGRFIQAHEIAKLILNESHRRFMVQEIEQLALLKTENHPESQLLSNERRQLAARGFAVIAIQKAFRLIDAIPDSEMKKRTALKAQLFEAAVFSNQEDRLVQAIQTSSSNQVEKTAFFISLALTCKRFGRLKKAREIAPEVTLLPKASFKRVTAM